MSEGQKGKTVGLFLAGFLYPGTCTSEQITTTLLGGAKLKDKSREVILYSELQQLSKLKHKCWQGPA